MMAVAACAVNTSNPCSAKTVRVSPASNIAELVKASPEGTAFHFAPGIYRRVTISPKNRQQFIGRPGVILNGAVILKQWRQVDGLWQSPGPEKLLKAEGMCDDRGKYCRYREDLFVDGQLHERARSLEELGSAKWFERKWYYEEGKVFLNADPRDRLVELGVTPYAFVSKASGVVIRDLIVEKYASMAQRGAIEFLSGSGWRLINVVARWNHGVGARIGPGTQIIGGSYSHNGQLGIGGGYGAGIVVDGAEIAFNNYAGYSMRWEAGGTKFVATRGLKVRNTCVHDNFGPGLWTDIDNIDVEYVRNKVFNNRGEGIKHEISYSAIIRENLVARNGHDKDRWLWGSQILVQNSPDVVVRDNVVEVDRTYGNGISIIQQDRGEGEYGPRISYRNRVENNLVIFLGRNGLTGMVIDNGDVNFWTDGGNVFDSNSYIVTNDNRSHFRVRGQEFSWSEYRNLGYETNGTLKVKVRSPLQIRCSP